MAQYPANNFDIGV